MLKILKLLPQSFPNLTQVIYPYGYIKHSIFAITMMFSHPYYGFPVQILEIEEKNSNNDAIERNPEFCRMNYYQHSV